MDCVAVKGNAKVLLISIALFGTITTIQFFFALASHSDALLVDCASMLVDTLTYVGNLYSECRQKSTAMSPAEKARFSLATSALSLAVLFTITGWGLSDAIGTITAENVEDDLDGAVVVASAVPEPVEPRKRNLNSTVRRFGVFGIVFDFCAFYAFGKYGDPAKSAGGDEKQIDVRASEMNMWTAISHVGADSVRSLTSIVIGVVALSARSANGSLADAWGALFSSCTIIASASLIAVELLRGVVAYRRARKEPPPAGLLRGFASSRADFVARAVTRATSASSDDEAAADVELPPREPEPGDAHLV